MSRKAILITIGVLIVATSAIVVVVAIVAAFVFLAPSGDTVSISAVTAVGAPNGTATTKSIGPEGGTLASSDGKITVTVPSNSVSQTAEFRIQPITNLADGGVGNAYRLEPSDQNFATPVEVSFNLEAQGLKNFAPESIAIAYQDKSGIWQAFKTVNIDRVKKTVSVSTNHFTDFSVWTMRLSPETATLRVRQTQIIELQGCLLTLNPLSRLRALIGRPDCFRQYVEGRWSVDYGAIIPAGSGAVLYRAPATKPPGNKATVRFVFKLAPWEKTDQWEAREAEITIVERGYRATGSDGGVAYSGLICDLEQQFTVTATHKLYVAPLAFVPSSRTTGSMGYAAAGSGIKAKGKGSYTIEGLDTDKPRILVNTSSTARIPVKETSGGGLATIYLVPIDPNSRECGNY